MKMPSLSGAVLVGGRSARMGRSKARLLLDGEPLWHRQRRLLARCGATPVLLVLRPGQHSLGLRAWEIRDHVRAVGPLAGVAAALAAGPGEFLALVAVDLPALGPAWFDLLQRHCRPGRGAVFRTRQGFEPLAAIYPHSAGALAATHIAGGQYRLQDFVRALVRRRLLTAVPLPDRLAPMAANWNRPGDRAAFQAVASTDE